jgi:hypothetical protein
MMPVQPESQVRGQSKQTHLNWNARATVADIVAALGATIAAPLEPVAEPQTRDNQVAVLSGDHGGLSVTMPDTHLRCAPGAIFSRQSTLRASCKIAGAWFKGATADTLVSIVDAGATAVFCDCRFTKPAGANGSYITLVAGARAHFIGCTFDGVQSAGNVVNNAGVAADAFILGCSNKTTRAHVNVTTIAETA